MHAALRGESLCGCGGGGRDLDPHVGSVRAAILDRSARRRSGWYAAPIYAASISRQMICSIGASAVGNSSG